MTTFFGIQIFAFLLHSNLFNNAYHGNFTYLCFCQNNKLQKGCLQNFMLNVGSISSYP